MLFYIPPICLFLLVVFVFSLLSYCSFLAHVHIELLTYFLFIHSSSSIIIAASNILRKQSISSLYVSCPVTACIIPVIAFMHLTSPSLKHFATSSDLFICFHLSLFFLVRSSMDSCMLGMFVDSLLCLPILFRILDISSSTFQHHINTMYAYIV